ncbi:MAG: hypothetical protein ABI837_00625 [Acidobacteriota bacterium]
MEIAGEETTDRPQRVLLIVTAIVVAATRLMAIAKSVWDWDEVLFSLALNDYDVAAHHPHPPGFPLYVALARMARLFVRQDFHALQAVNFLAAVLIFPAVYFLGRAFRFDFATSYTAGLLFAFIPAVWFLGGTGFSDIPGLVFLLLAILFLLRGRGSSRAYVLGSVLLGLALGVRPQSGLQAAFPWIAATWSRRGRWQSVMLGACLTFSIVAASYATAAWITGVASYRKAVHAHGEYLMKVDSYRNTARPAPLHLVGDFLLHPDGGSMLVPLVALAALGLLRARKPSLEVLATFGPFFVAALFLLDINSVSRYSIGYFVMVALLAAEGLRLVVRPVTIWRPFAGMGLQLLLALALTGRMVWWSVPAIREVHRHASPPAEAMQWIHEHLDWRKATIYVHGSMGPHAEYFLGAYRQVYVDTGDPIAIADARDAWYLTEGTAGSADGLVFTRKRSTLFGIARRRYFEVSVYPLSDAFRFGSGWYDQESSGPSAFRWMGRSSLTQVPPISGKGTLRLRFYVPLDGQRKPVVTVTFNGIVVDQVTCVTAEVERRYLLPSRIGTSNELRLDVDQVVNPAREHLGTDGRDLGVQLSGYSWMPE